MSRFMRPSKYRHVFADKPKKECTYENARVSNSAWDTNLIAAGGTYLSLNWQVSGGGAFAIIPLASPFSMLENGGKLPDLLPLARGHSGPVLDTCWSPFDDNLVASGGEDGKICIFKVSPADFANWSADDFEPKDWEPIAKMSAGGRKVGQLLFHPTASNVLASASGDHVVRLWDIEKPEEPVIVLEAHGDTIQDMAWNSDGTLLATTCRDKKIRIFDPRSGPAPIKIADGHAGVKGSRVVWAGDRNRIITTGFSKTSDRQVKIWNTDDLTEVKGLQIDQSSGVMMPFYSEANDILFLAGKGDGNIRYYEFDQDNLHFLTEHGSKDPQRGMTFLPRRALDVSENEVARGFKVTGNCIEPLGFVVPRKAETFQADIFPPALSAEPALTAAEWFSGKTAAPKLVNLQDGSAAAYSSSPANNINSKPTSIPTRNATAPSSLPSPTPATAAPTTHIATAPAAASPVPEKREEKDSLPEMKTLDREPATEEESEDEKEEPKTNGASSMGGQTYAAGVVNVAEATKGSSSSAGGGEESTALREENARLTEELRELRAKTRGLELQVETMKANASKIVKQLSALDQQ